MGRISMPILNKNGYSMYWNSMWDDKINYSRSLQEDIFLKNFIYLLFEGGSKFFFLNLKSFEFNFLNLKKKYIFQTKKIFKKDSIGNIINYKLIFKKKDKFRPFLSKIWLLRYQTWVILYFYVYSYNLSLFFKKIKKNKFRYINYHNVLLNYYKNTIKLKYNFNNNVQY